MQLKRQQNCELTESKTENCRFWGYKNLGSAQFFEAGIQVEQNTL
jgi:hypothetical protein